ncbi:MAG: hypothetical protein RMI91_02420, partial [Gemmatales bacterium]|nr:hypothetical protein [Gemmatales bacterium]
MREWLPRWWSGNRNSNTSASPERNRSRPKKRVWSFYPHLETLEERSTPSTSIPLNPLTWTSLGPLPTPTLALPTNTYAGRVNAVAPHPTDPNILYLGAHGGGVWKTTNGGITWTFLTGAPQIPSQFIGSLAVARSNPNVIYAGTGTAFFTIDSYPGAGLLVSTDGGVTWFVSDGDANPDGPSGTDTNLEDGPFYRRAITAIAVHPSDPNTVYVAVSEIGMQHGRTDPDNAKRSGIYKSVDGGRSWVNLTHDKIQDSGSVLSVAQLFSDVEIDPANPNRIIAAVGTPSGWDLNGLWVSNDAGASWSRMLSFPTGKFEPRVGRIRLAISPNNPGYMYAVITDAAVQPDGAVYRVLRSTDGGANWTPLSLPTVPNPPPILHRHVDIAVHPFNPLQVVVAGGQGANSIIISFNGGNSWFDLSTSLTPANLPH